MTRKFIKKLSIALTLSVTLVSNGGVVTTNAFVSEETYKLNKIVTDSDAPNLLENYDKDSMLCKKLSYDEENNTTSLSNEVEESLNKVGVFDSEIDELDAETLDCLENAIYTEVYISYVNVDEVTGEAVELTNAEIDEIIEEKIEDGEIEYKKKKDVFLTKCIGIIPQEVYAADVYYDDDESSESVTKAVKQTIYACQYKKGGTIYVTASATWLKEAYYRNKDVFMVSVDNADIISKSYSCTHTATYSYFSMYTGNTIENVRKTKPNTYYITNNGDGIAYVVNLFDSRPNLIAVQASGAGITNYKNEKITIKFKCTVANENVKKVTLVPHYFHAKTNVSVSPKISVSQGGITVSASGKSKNYYKEITNNSILQYNYK